MTRWLVIFGILGGLAPMCRGTEPVPAGASVGVITEIGALKNLTQEQARQHRPVRVRGVVTYFDMVAPNLFIQDGDRGTWVKWSSTAAKPIPGQVIEIDGVTSQDGFAPDVTELRHQVIGQAAMPEPMRPSFEQMASTMEDSRWVEVEGIVRSVGLEEGGGGRLRFNLTISGGQILAQTPDFVSIPIELVDAKVRIQGVCGASFNARRQITGTVIHMPSLARVQVVEAAPADPFAVPLRPVGDLQRFSLQQTSGHRVHVRGVVTASLPGEV
ncbi:MAG: hypothetical protein ABSG25_13205, partial [Bryobacteraceae bacterium]